MKMLPGTESALYEAWPGAPRAIVMTIELAEALDALIDVVDRVVVESQGAPPDVVDALNALRQRHEYTRVRLGGMLR